MDLFSYRVFLTIVEQKSFQKAAEIHNVTPPAISHIVKQLEQKFGFSLFVRSRSGVELTANGEEVKGLIRDIVNSENRLNQSIAEMNGLSRGHVRLGIFNSMCVYLSDLIRTFHVKYPQITFEIFQGSYEDIIEWLKNGTVDIGFLSKTVNPGFDFFEIFSDPLMCILQKGIDVGFADEIPLKELDAHSFVMQRESCDADARKLMDELKLDVRTVCHVVDDKTTVEMVKAGFGFAIMPRLTMNGFEDEVRMLAITPAKKRVIGAAVRDSKDLPPAVKKYLEHVRAYTF